MTTNNKQAIVIENPIVIPFERISDLLTGALEGGSNYWYFIEEFIAPKYWEFESTPKAGEGKHYAQDYALNVGGELILSDKEGDDESKRYELNLNTIEQGLRVFAKKYPKHFADFQSENDDATTADVFLQCCVFGEVIYG